MNMKLWLKSATEKAFVDVIKEGTVVKELKYAALLCLEYLTERKTRKHGRRKISNNLPK